MSLLYHSGQEPGLDQGSSGPGPFDHLVVQEPPPDSGNQGQAFPRPNGYAFPVNQRSARKWSGHTYQVTGQAGKATRLLTAQRGRKGFLIAVANSAAAAIYVDSNQESLVAPGISGFFVDIGAAFGLDTEDELWAVSATPGTPTQVSIAVTWDTGSPEN